MPKNSAAVSVGVRLNTKDIVSAISQLASTLSMMGQNVDISGEFGKQINEMKKEVVELQNKLNNLNVNKVDSKAFSSMQSGILDQIGSLEDRTTSLELTVGSLIKTLGSADGGKMEGLLSSLRENMDKTAASSRELMDSIGAVVTVAGDSGGIKIIDEDGLQRQLDSLERYIKGINNAINEESELVAPKFNVDITGAEDAEKQLRNVVENYKRHLSDFNSMSSDDPGYIKKSRYLVDAAQRLYKVQDAILNNDEFGSLDLFPDLQNEAADLIQTFSSVESAIQSKADSIRMSLNSIRSDLDYVPKTGDVGQVKIPVGFTPDKKGLVSRLTVIMDAVRSSAAKNPIELEIDILQKNQSKRAKKALKDLQEQIGGIEDPDIRKNMEGLLNVVGTDFAHAFTVGLKSDLNDAAESVRAHIKDIKSELAQKNNEIVINPKIEFTDEEISKATSRVNELANELNEKLANEVKNNLLGEAAGEESAKKMSSFAKLAAQLKSIVSNIEEIPNKFSEMPVSLGEGLEAATLHLEDLKESFVSLDSIDMGVAQVQSLTEELTKARDVLEQMVSLTIGDTSGLSSLLKQFDQASWLASGAAGSKRNTAPYEELIKTYPSLFNVESDSYIGTFKSRDKDYSKWARNIVKTIGQNRDKLNDAEKGLYSNTFDNINFKNLGIDPDRIQSLAGSIEDIVSGLSKVSQVMPENLEKANQSLLGIADSFAKLNGIEIEDNGLNSFNSQLETTLSLLSKIVSLISSGSGNILKDMLKEWNASDLDMISFANDKEEHIRERSAVYTKSGKLYGQYSYGDKHSTGMMYPAIARSIANGETPYMTLHTHPNKHIASMSYGNPGKGHGDISAWTFQKDIEKQIVAVLGEVEVFDAKRFYEDFSNIDFSSQKVMNALLKKRKGVSEKYKIGKSLTPFFDTLLDDYAGGFESSMEDYISYVIQNLGKNPEKYKIGDYVSRIRENFKKRNSGDSAISNPLLEPLSELFIGSDLSNDWIRSIDKFTPGKILKHLGINFNNDDIYNYQLRKILPEVLEEAVGISQKDFLSGNYIEHLSIDEFSDKYGISSDSFNNIFKNTGIESFSSNVNNLAESLSKIAETISSIGPDGIKLGFEDGEAISANIERIVSGINELISLYKELNSLGEFSIDTDKLTGFLKDLGNNPDILTLASKFKESFGDSWGFVHNIWQSTMPSKGDLSDSDYTKWTKDFINSALDAGVALDKFKKEQKEFTSESQNLKIDIDNEQFDKLVQNTTTLKNSLNSLRKESDLSPIIESIQKLTSTLLEFSEVVQKSTGILSGSKLSGAFDRLKAASSLMDGRTGKDKYMQLVSAYNLYKEKGGTESLDALGGTEKFQEKLHKYYEEAKSLKDVVPAATEAAEAKSKFSDANGELLKSIIASIAGLDNEGKAFQNLAKMFSTLGNDKDGEKINRVKSSLEEIIKLLNTPVGADSFMKSLEGLASSGDGLKDLATVLKATKKQIDNAKTVASQNDGAPKFDYSQERLNKESESIARNGAEFLRQYGTVIDTIVRENSDGLIELIGVVKTAENELSEFKLTSADGKRFNITERKTNTPQLAKQWMQWQRMRKAWEDMQKVDPHITDQITFDPDASQADRDAWESMKELAKDYYDQIGNIQKITRQVRQDSHGDLLESFSFFGDKGHITMGREGDIVASHQDLANVTGIEAEYQKLYSTAKNYYQLKMKAASGDATPYEIRQLEELENQYAELLAKVKKYHEELGDTTADDALNKFQQDIGKDFDDYLNKSRAKYEEKINTVNRTRENQRNDFTPEFADTLDKAADAWERIQEAQSRHANGEAWDVADLERVVSALKEIDNAYDGINRKQNIAARTEDVDKLIQRASKDLNENSLSPALASKYQDLIDSLMRVRSAGGDAADGLAAINQVDLGKFGAQLRELQAELQRTGQTGKGFWKQFAGAVTSKSANFLAQYFSLQDIIRYGREAVQIVTQINSANIELKKVSDASNERIQQSFQKSAQTAQELGSTITDVINSTADWARLGYSVDQAEELARVTTLYQTVGDNMTQESASQSLVSMLQGFQMDYSQAERIVDSVNEVANNYAIDTAGGQLAGVA